MKWRNQCSTMDTFKVFPHHQFFNSFLLKRLQKWRVMPWHASICKWSCWFIEHCRLCYILSTRVRIAPLLFEHPSNVPCINLCFPDVYVYKVFLPENGTSLSSVGPSPLQRASQPSLCTAELITALSSLYDCLSDCSLVRINSNGLIRVAEHTATHKSHIWICYFLNKLYCV